MAARTKPLVQAVLPAPKSPCNTTDVPRIALGGVVSSRTVAKIDPISSISSTVGTDSVREGGGTVESQEARGSVSVTVTVTV